MFHNIPFSVDALPAKLINVSRFLPALILIASLRPAFALTAADLGDEIQHLSLDPAECYRVLDLNFNKEDVKVYLASGYLIFTKPVFSNQSNSNQGTHLGAVFVASALHSPPSLTPLILRNTSNPRPSSSPTEPATIFSPSCRTIRPPRRALRWAALSPKSGTPWSAT